MGSDKDALTVKVVGRTRRTRKIRSGIWADLKGLHIDRRTRVGRWMDHLRSGLIRHVGGEPTIAESILIEQITIKCLKSHLYHVGLFKNKAFGSKDHALAIQNSIRLDLQALGFQRRQKKILDLTEYLEEKQKKQ